MSAGLSIIIPCYSEGPWLSEAITSALATNWQPLEVVVVNDGSKHEATLRELDRWRNTEKVRIIDQPNGGLARARNRGISEAHFPYILPLDADNQLLPDYGKLGVTWLEQHPEDDIFYSDVQHFGGVERIHKVYPFILQRLMMYNYIDACAVYRKSLWEKLRGYDPDMPAMGIEDWDFWLRAGLSNAGFHHHPAPLYRYRVRPDSMITATTAPKMAALRAYLNQKYAGKLHTALPATYVHERMKKKPLLTLAKVVLGWAFPQWYQAKINSGAWTDV